jgi:hypothetical protein
MHFYDVQTFSRSLAADSAKDDVCKLGYSCCCHLYAACSSSSRRKTERKINEFVSVPGYFLPFLLTAVCISILRLRHSPISLPPQMTWNIIKGRQSLSLSLSLSFLLSLHAFQLSNYSSSFFPFISSSFSSLFSQQQHQQE